MLSQKYLALNSKLSTIEPNKKAHLLSYLPEHIRQKLSEPDFPQQTINVTMTPDKIARRIDVSHFEEFLSQLPDAEKNLYIASFPGYKQLQITKESSDIKELKSIKFAHFVLVNLCKKVLNDFPPPSILPHHPIIELLGDSGISLSKLIHYLGLIDVAAEVKQIISQEKLKSLQESFDGEEVDFMNKIGHNKRPILSALNLAAYDGDKKRLEEMILNRGMYRFVQGIKGAPAEYRFFFTYFLPKDLSDYMTKLLKQKPQFCLNYRYWEADVIYTWRFLCTYSK